MISLFPKRASQIRESGDKSVFDSISYEGAKIRLHAGARFFKRVTQRIFGASQKKTPGATPCEVQIDVPTVCTHEDMHTPPAQAQDTYVISPVPVKPFNPAISLFIEMFTQSNSLDNVYAVKATGAVEVTKPVGVKEAIHPLRLHDDHGVAEDRCRQISGSDDPAFKATSEVKESSDPPSPSNTVVPADKVNDSNFNGVFARNVMSLREKLIRDGPFDETTARNLLAQLLHVVHRMHLSGVIHRNITPDSIMVDQRGNFTLCGFNHSVTFDAWTADPSSLPLYPKSYSEPGVENPYLVGRPPGHTSNVYIPCSALFLCRASFNIDFAAIAFVYHEMRAGLGSLPIEFVIVPGPNKFELRRDILDIDELDFIERLLNRQPGRRFECVRDMMQHKVFSGIEWENVCSM